MSLTKEQWLASERDIVTTFFTQKVTAQYPQTIQVNEDKCYALARSLLGTDDVKLVDNQGFNSFTLFSPSKGKVIQFRLDVFQDATLQLALKIYGNQIPSRASLPHGFEDFPLPVYVSDVIPGVVHILQPFPEQGFPLDRQLNTVTDLARFIAKATFFPQDREALRKDGWTATASQFVARLCRNNDLAATAPEIYHIVAQLKDQLHLLDTLPPVLSHDDLAEINVFVDEEGHITGVIDFESAGVEAFGMSIWGLYECWLGGMNDARFAFFDFMTAESGGRTVREVLENVFWTTLWSEVNGSVLRREHEAAIRVALAMGVLRRYFTRDLVDKVTEGDMHHIRSLAYAKAILPAVWLRKIDG
ncbi:hypothetical protein ANO11243_063090 [Dothideomycetidae sp. 11243]|nr:hypothetical protein ANO11243_063090 [fungal sp. No.11243]